MKCENKDIYFRATYQTSGTTSEVCFHAGPAWLPGSVSCHFVICVNS